MNFIKAFNSVLEKISSDENLNPTHVALYLSLFHTWNQSHFRNPISINRAEVLRVCKIGSHHTYHKCIWDLHNWGYIEYLPSYNPVKGSKINLYNFDISDEQVLPRDNANIETGSEQALPPFKNNLNNKNTNKNEIDVQNPNLKNGAYEFLFKNENLKNFATKPDFTETIPSTIPPSQKEKGLGDEVINTPHRQNQGVLLPEVKAYFKSEKWPETEAEKFFNYYEANGWLIGGKTPMKSWKAAAIRWIQNSYKFNASKNEKPSKLSSNPNKDYSEPL